MGVLQGLPSDVDVALTPEEIEGLDEAALKALYDEKVKTVVAIKLGPQSFEICLTLGRNSCNLLGGRGKSCIKA
jgi:hypothetical protein